MKEEHVEVASRARPTVQERLLSNLDFLVCGLVGLLLIFELTVGLLPVPETGPAAARVRTASAELEAALAEPPKELEQRRKRVDAFLGELQASFAAPSAREGSPSEVAWPDEFLEATRAGESNELRFHAPTALTGSAERGFNELRWAIDPDDNVSVAEFVVLRAAPERAEVEIARVAGSERTFRDETVEAGRQYTYRVRSRTDDQDLRPAQRLSPPSRPVDLVAATDFRIELLGADRSERTARLRVEKWHEGEWWPREFDVREGEAIGVLDQGSGVEYRTGRTLAQLEFSEREQQRTVREPIFLPDGRVKVEAGVVVRESVVKTVEVETIRVRLEGGGLAPRELSLERGP